MGYIIDTSRCVGCGACAYECLFGIPKPVDEEKSRYHIDREECIGCGQCSRVCPVNAIVKDPKQPVIRKVTIEKELCIGCSLCSRVCKAGAPQGELKAPFEIDQKKCFRCGLCAEKCPKKAISVEYEDRKEAKEGRMIYRLYCKIFQAVMVIAQLLAITIH